MRLAGRYAEFRATSGTRVREPLLAVPATMPELELQARWFAGEFGRRFKTVRGDELEIVQFGNWTREAGPDFAEAAISINGAEPQRGCIEIDPEARDWERHGHATNADYETVILHVFTQAGPAVFFTRTSRNREVPQLLLDVRGLDVAPPNPSPLAIPGRCLAPLRELPPSRVIDILEAAAQFRLQRKAARLEALTVAHGPDEALYQSLAVTLGYKANKLPFTLLAQRLPLRFLRKNRDSATALCFGLSGFLPMSDRPELDVGTRGYVRALWEKWWSHRAGFERLTLPAGSWRLSGLRPANHPQRRLAALAQIAGHWPKVRAVAERCDINAAQKFFAALRDDYWDFHFTLTSAKQPVRLALIGRTRVTEMLANVFFPMAVSRETALWERYRKMPAELSNKRVAIAAARLFAGGARELLKTAARQQGLLQIYEDFCLQDNSDCARCPFPQQLAKWE